MPSTHIELRDRRRLGYVESGPREGMPVLYCHGAIGTPLERSVELEAIVWDLGVRHVAVSRPGFGGSDPAPGRGMLSFAADLRELADALGLQRFDLVGVSAGGPYALAAAHEMGERVRRVALCSSLSPLCAPHRTRGLALRNRLALGLLASAPGLCVALGDRALPLIRHHPGVLARLVAAGAERPERPALRGPAEALAASSSFLDAARDGVRGMIDDYLVCCRAWDFSPSGVSAEVQLWHGLADRLVRVDHALALAATLPRCEVFFDPDEGHHFFRRRLREILATLVGAPAPAGSGLIRAPAAAAALRDRRRARA
jgi:pimeloyl-ACP methyl ester carboxylesterase